MSPGNGADFGRFEHLCRELKLGKLRRLDVKRPVWIFGAGRFGKDISAVLRDAGFQVRGFIETKPREATVLGLQVKAWADLDPAAPGDQLVLGIFNHRTPFSALESLAQGFGFKQTFMPWDLYAQFGHELGWRYWLGEPGTILGAMPLVESAYRLLGDEESRLCFLRTLEFRFGQDTEFGAFQHEGMQYFNDITMDALPENLGYVDGGAYNGDTFLELARRRKVGAAYLFEPDPENFRALVDAVRDFPAQTLCLPLGLMDDCRSLSFRADGMDSSAISEEGTVHIATASLDQVLGGHRVDFIKMDIEGSEMAALRGGASLIRSCRPVLALSLYHRPDDLWNLPLAVAELCPDYRFSIRQHCFNSFESVFYAVPNERSPA